MIQLNHRDEPVEIQKASADHLPFFAAQRLAVIARTDDRAIACCENWNANRIAIKVYAVMYFVLTQFGRAVQINRIRGGRRRVERKPTRAANCPNRFRRT